MLILIRANLKRYLLILMSFLINTLMCVLADPSNNIFGSLADSTCLGTVGNFQRTRSVLIRNTGIYLDGPSKLDRVK